MNYYTPFMHDDYAYCFFYDNNSEIIRPTSTRVTSFLQLLESQFNHYCDVNGRFTSHVLIQLFCAIVGKPIFNIINTLIFLILIDTIVSFFSRSHRILVSSIVLFAFIYFIPVPGQTMLWLTGSINYMWTLCFTLLFIKYIICNNSHSKSISLYILIIFICIFIGWMNESISIGVTSGLFVYFIFNKEKFAGLIIPAYIGYTLGTLAIVFSPGTLSRIHHGGELYDNFGFISTIYNKLYNFSISYIESALPILALGVILFIYYTNKNRLNHPFFYIYLTTSLFLLFLGLEEKRIYFGLSSFSLILILKLINLRIKHPQFISIFIFSTCIPNILSAKNHIINYKNYNDQQTFEILNSNESSIVLKETRPPKENRFTYITTIGKDRYNFHNRVRAFYYNKTSIQAIPETIYNRYISNDEFLKNSTKVLITSSHPDIVGNIYTSQSESYYYVPIDPSYLLKKKVLARYTKQQTDVPLKAYQLIIRTLLGTLNQNSYSKDCFYIEKDNTFYLVLPKDEFTEEISIPIWYNKNCIDLIIQLDRSKNE